MFDIIGNNPLLLMFFCCGWQIFLLIGGYYIGKRGIPIRWVGWQSGGQNDTEI